MEEAIMSTPNQTPNPTPDTLPADFFSRQPQGQASNPQAPVSAEAPDTLPADFFSRQQQPSSAQTQAPTATIGPIRKPAHIGEALEQWTDNVLNDIKYGTDLTGVGTVLKKMGAHGVYAGNPEAVGDFMASLPLGVLKMIRGGAKVS